MSLIDVPLAPFTAAPTLPEAMGSMSDLLAKLRQHRLQAQYGPAQAEAATQMAQAKAQNLPEKLRLANLLTQTRAETLPQQLQTALMNARTHRQMLAHSRSRYDNPAYKLRMMLSTLSPSARAGWIAKHSDFMAKILGSSVEQSALGAQGPSRQPTSVTSVGGPPPTGLPGSALQTLMQSSAHQGVFQTPQTAQAALRSNIMHRGDESNAPPPPKREYTPREGTSDIIKKTSEMAANRGLTSPQMRQRLEAADSLDIFLSNPRIQNVLADSTYAAGIIGKGRAFLDSLKKDQPERYRDYIEFDKSLSQNWKNALKQMEKLGSDVEQRKELDKQVKYGLSNLTSNPRSALDAFKRAYKEMGEISASVRRVAQPVFPGARERAIGIKGPLRFAPDQQAQKPLPTLSQGQIQSMSPLSMDDLIKIRGQRR